MKEVQILKAIENGVVRDFKNNNKIPENLEIYPFSGIPNLIDIFLWLKGIHMLKFTLNISDKFCVLHDLINSNRFHYHQCMHTITHLTCLTLKF